MEEETKKCPFCAEIIKAEAIVCRYCGRDLTNDTPLNTNETIPASNENKGVKYLWSVSSQISIQCLNCKDIWPILNGHYKKVEGGFELNPEFVCNCGNSANFVSVQFSETGFPVGNKIEKRDIGLLRCPDCKKEISPFANACPNCGRPMSTGIKCPNCKSGNVEKISGASKLGSAIVFGVFAVGKLTKTYQCKDCGFKW